MKIKYEIYVDTTKVDIVKLKADLKSNISVKVLQNNLGEFTANITSKTVKTDVLELNSLKITFTVTVKFGTAIDFIKSVRLAQFDPTTLPLPKDNIKITFKE